MQSFTEEDVKAVISTIKINTRVKQLVHFNIKPGNDLYQFYNRELSTRFNLA